MPQVFAYIMPIRRKQLEKILVQDKRIIAKFFSKPRGAPRLRRGTIIVFYESREGMKLVGQGTVQQAEMMLPHEVIPSYGASFFLNKQELDDYVDRFPGRREKKLLILHLENIFSYASPVRWATSPTMAGAYLTRDDYARLIKEIN